VIQQLMTSVLPLQLAPKPFPLPVESLMTWVDVRLDRPAAVADAGSPIIQFPPALQCRFGNGDWWRMGSSVLSVSVWLLQLLCWSNSSFLALLTAVYLIHFVHLINFESKMQQ
jgi:hypothetical protein